MPCAVPCPWAFSCALPLGIQPPRPTLGLQPSLLPCHSSSGWRPSPDHPCLQFCTGKPLYHEPPGPHCADRSWGPLRLVMSLFSLSAYKRFIPILWQKMRPEMLLGDAITGNLLKSPPAFQPSFPSTTFDVKPAHCFSGLTQRVCDLTWWEVTSSLSLTFSCDLASPSNCARRQATTLEPAVAKAVTTESHRFSRRGSVTLLRYRPCCCHWKWWLLSGLPLGLVAYCNKGAHATLSQIHI